MRNRRLPKYLNKDAVRRMIEEAGKGYHKKRNITLLTLMYTTGLRVSEVEQLNIEDVAENGNIVYSFYLVGKGNKERVVFLPQKTRKLLSEYLEDRIWEYGPLFIHGPNKRLMARGIRELIKRIGIRANITIKTENGRKPPTPHTFRHSFAVNLLNEGMDIMKVQQLMGHSDVSTTQVYTQLSNKDLVESLRKIDW